MGVMLFQMDCEIFFQNIWLEMFLKFANILFRSSVRLVQTYIMN